MTLGLGAFFGCTVVYIFVVCVIIHAAIFDLMEPPEGNKGIESTPVVVAEDPVYSDEFIAAADAVHKAISAGKITMLAKHQNIEPYTPQINYDDAPQALYSEN